MPLYLTNKGEAVYENTKLLGVHANITHSIDGWVLRQIGRAMSSVDRVVLFKHDKFFSHPNNLKFVNRVYKASLMTEYTEKPYHRAIDEIISNRKGKKILAPTLIEGSGTLAMIDRSEAYLSA